MSFIELNVYCYSSFVQVAIHAIRPNCRREGDKLHADIVIMLEDVLEHICWAIGTIYVDTMNDTNQCCARKH